MKLLLCTLGGLVVLAVASLAFFTRLGLWIPDPGESANLGSTEARLRSGLEEVEPLERAGRLGEAEAELRQTLAESMHLLGPTHRLTAHAQSRLSELLLVTGRVEEAGEQARASVAALRQVAGTHVDLADALDALGVTARARAMLLEQLGEDSAAERQALSDAAAAHREAAGIRARARDSREMQQRSLAWAELAAAQLRRAPARAELALRRALEAMSAREGRVDPRAADLALDLARSVEASETPARAEPSYRQALALREAASGATHPRTLEAALALTDHLLRQGRDREAEELVEESVGAYRSALARGTRAPDPPRIGAARLLIERSSLLLARRGHPERAWVELETALSSVLYENLSRRFASPLSDEERSREQSLGMQLLELNTSIAVLGSTPTDAALREGLRSRREDVLAQWIEFTSELRRRYGASLEPTLPLSEAQRTLAPDAAFVAFLDTPTVPRERLDALRGALILRSAGPPRWLPLPGSGPAGAWTFEDRGAAAALRRELAGVAPLWPGSAVAEASASKRWKERVRALHRLLFPQSGSVSPAGSGLPPVRHWIVLPSRTLAGVPLELLIPDNEVSYAPSASVASWSRAREAAGHARDAHVLAVGDPVFELGTEPEPLEGRPWLGGLVVGFVPGSNGSQAGIRIGDVLLSYEDTPILTSGDLLRGFLKVFIPRWWNNEDVHQPVRLEVWRAGEVLEFGVRNPLGLRLIQMRSSEMFAAERRIEGLRRGASLLSDPLQEPALPASRREVERVAALARQATVLLGSDASEQRLVALARSGELARFSEILLATHLRLDDVDPLQSSLSLARDRLPDPGDQALGGEPAYTGRLSAERILRMGPIDADLVVLSACQSALAAQRSGEGYVGMSHVLLGAGARSVLGSLWKVHDTATALLMIRFHENWFGKRAGLTAPMSKLEALREAQSFLRGLDARQAERLASEAGLAYNGEWFAHPAYWAAFVLNGDWR